MNYWEDLSAGQIFETGSITIESADIIEFASQFDPQPYHLDPVYAESSIFGGHCASGWQICALMMRLLADTLNEHGLRSGGSNGVPSLRWFKPVFAGDSLRAKITIDELHPTTGFDGYGRMDISINVSNQHGDGVIELTTDVIVARRELKLAGAGQ